jgi:hypothetical protein
MSALGEKERVHLCLPAVIIKIDVSHRDESFVWFIGNSFLCPGNLSIHLKGTARAMWLLLFFIHHKAVIQLIYYLERL